MGIKMLLVVLLCTTQAALSAGKNAANTNYANYSICLPRSSAFNAYLDSRGCLEEIFKRMGKRFHFLRNDKKFVK